MKLVHGFKFMCITKLNEQNLYLQYRLNTISSNYIE